MQLKNNPVAEYGYTLADRLCIERNTLVQTPPSLRTDSVRYSTQANEFKEWYTNKAPDLALVVAYGKILPQEIVDIPFFGSLNIH
jgi:methionyl-tRNA formyltransferase